MPRPVGRLTAIATERHHSPGRLADGGGLYLYVSRTGTKSWVFMWVRRGNRREMGLGPYPAISLKAARQKATSCRTLIAEGLDPIAERRRERQKTFGECADLYIQSMEGQWRNDKHRYQWRQTLGSYCEIIRDRPVTALATEDILSVLQPIWASKNETASRLRGRIELVLDYAKAKGWRTGDNPARWRGHLKNILPARKKLSRGHLAAMRYQDVPTFIHRLRKAETLAARALEFAILTAGRTGEVLNATWSEIDLENALWTIPAQRMKAGEEHVVPLSDATLAILRPLHETRTTEFVFPGQKPGKPLSGMAMEMLLRRLKVEKATVHGFRSSFRDWCGDETSFPREVAEAALAHKVGNVVERAYRRGKAIEKRRKVMEAWAGYCDGRETGSVVALRRTSEAGA